MNRRNLLTAFALAATVGIGAAFTAQDEEKKAELGKEAPNFTLKDLDGKEVTLKEIAKDKIVVLQWVNPGCPVCARVNSSGLEKEMLDAIKEMDDVVHIAINSTFAADDNNPETNKAALKRYGLEYTVLLDNDGKVGKTYGAKTTPHIYVIDKEGMLRYEGAFDDDPAGRKEEKTNYALNAIKQIKAGETVTPDQTRSYGCAVKYEPAG